MAGHGNGQDKGGGGGRGKELAAASYSSEQKHNPYLVIQTLQFMSSTDFYKILEAKVENLQIPKIDGVPLDLYRIFVEVAFRGGIDKVIKNGQFEEMCSVLPQRITPPHLYEVYKSLLHSLEYDFSTLTELQLGSSASPGSVQGVDTPGFNLNLSLQLNASEMPNPELYNKAIHANSPSTAPQPRLSARKVKAMAQPGLPPFDAQVVATQQREPNASSVPQPGFSAHPSPAQYHAARPSSSARSFHNQRLILPKPPLPGAQVIATQQSEGMSQYSTAMHWNSTATAPQPGSSARLIPAQGEAGREVLPPETQAVAMQQREGNFFAALPQTSYARPALTQDLGGRHPYFPSTAPQPSSSATPQGITETKLTFPEAQVDAKRQRTVTGPLPGAPPISSASWVPNQEVVDVQMKEGNFFVEYVRPVSAQYLEGIHPYSPSTAPQSTSSAKMEQTQYHKAYAPHRSLSATPLAIPEAQGSAKRKGTATCSSPGAGDTLTSLVNRPMEDPPCDILLSWGETVDSATVTNLLQSTPSAYDFSSIEHQAIDGYQGTPAETQKAVDKLELFMNCTLVDKRDSEGEKNEDTEVSTELSLGVCANTWTAQAGSTSFKG